MRKLKMWSLWLVVTMLFTITMQVICNSQALAEEKQQDTLEHLVLVKQDYYLSVQPERWNAIQRKLEEKQRAEQEKQQQLAEAKQKAETAAREAKLAKQKAVVQAKAVAKPQVAERHVDNVDNSVTLIANYTKLPVSAVQFMVEECQNKQVPVSVVLGLIEKESTFNPHAVNAYSGAAGLGQIEENTAASLAARAGVAYSRASLFDPSYNLRLVIVYLDYLRSQTGDWSAALTAYNRGLGGYQAYRRATGTSASSYSRGVLANAAKARVVTGAS